ncbi:uncharacterized protein At5g65660-like isoform X2 [Punica granatum]|uniref:Uncharacterized protein At5g65660-like isoform X2 n=1 Tax=Punica granatum TaxID=22663 RepID=A0A6P8CU81_PUNGR|nr:uncharacterized protein At5g65660-like isoform X2 [Punica granatum]
MNYIEMRDPVPTPRNAGESRTSTGFFLGIASLLLFIIGLSMSITFCYFRKNLRLLCLSALNASELDIKPKAMSEGSKFRHGESLPVLMPGDRVPKFVALPCPCEPPREEKKVVEMQKATAAIAFSTVS